MTKPSAFLGLRTVAYQVPDVARAKEWYASVLGIAPYFDQPFYVGFNVGGFELGLHPAHEGPPAGPGGAVAYWGVERMTSAWERLIGLGAKPVSPPQDVGDGITGGDPRRSVREPDRHHREPGVPEHGGLSVWRTA